MTTTSDGRFDVTIDADGIVTIQPNEPGFSSDPVCMTVSEASALSGVLMGEVIKHSFRSVAEAVKAAHLAGRDDYEEKA